MFLPLAFLALHSILALQVVLYIKEMLILFLAQIIAEGGEIYIYA